ncbi:MAG: hypothetical protein QXK06_02455 [Candidatus Diapherotrites archaeon]
MNKKGGLFALSIGAMAIALLAVAVFSSQSAFWEEESEDYLAVMGDVKMAWANTVVLVDSIIGDVVNDCKCAALTQNHIDSNISNAMNSVFPAGATTIRCQTSGSTFNKAGSVSYSTTIDCERIFAVGGNTKFKAKITKTVSFSKPCPP